MGLGAWIDRQAEQQKYNANLGGKWSISGGVLKHGLTKIDPVGIAWTIQAGDQQSGATLTRVGVGVALAGPLGLLALASKKDKTRVYLSAVLPDGTQYIEDFPRKKEPDVRKFVANAENLARSLAVN